MSQVSLDLSGIASAQPGVPEPISTALSALQTAHNDTDTKLSNPSTGHDHDGTDSKALTQAVLPATTLDFASVTTNQGSITSEVDLTNLSVTVTVPSGGRRVRITGYCIATNSASSTNVLYIYEGTTQLSLSRFYNPTGATAQQMISQAIVTPSAGSHTYKLRGSSDAGNMQLVATANYPAFILVEII